MSVVKRTGLTIFICAALATADNTFSTFSVGLAIPTSNHSAVTLGSLKELANGWDAGWTFCGKPFADADNFLDGLALGGKINYCHWVRDSMFTQVTKLGMQGIVRYYFLPPSIPVSAFLQGGAGAFIGELDFASPDTVDPGFLDNTVIRGKKNFGACIGIGLNWLVIEIMPAYSITIRKRKEGGSPIVNSWITLSIGAAF